MSIPDNDDAILNNGISLVKRDTVIVVCGPTAIGKTALAIELAKHFDTSIISADSRQCFIELNIGVAKPLAHELADAPHYFINSHSIHDKVDAAIFENYALSAASTIFSQTKNAIMVGGTGMYIRAFCDGLDAIPQTDAMIEIAVREKYASLGLAWLQSAIKNEDPTYFKVGEIQNPQRLMRALEVKRSTGNSILFYQQKTKTTRPFDIIKIGLELPREILNQRINQRVDLMMEAGLLDEVKSLLPYQHLNALQTVGYKELFDYLHHTCSLETAVETLKMNTRRYAKRQMTWFKKDTSVNWFAPDSSSIVSFIESKMRH